MKSEIFGFVEARLVTVSTCGGKVYDSGKASGRRLVSYRKCIHSRKYMVLKDSSGKHKTRSIQHQ